MAGRGEGEARVGLVTTQQVFDVFESDCLIECRQRKISHRCEQFNPFALPAMQAQGIESATRKRACGYFVPLNQMREHQRCDFGERRRHVRK